MITLCKKTFQSLLGISSSSPKDQRRRHAAVPGGALILLSGDSRQSPPNVVESSAVSAGKPNSPAAKKDPSVSDDITTGGGCGGGGAAAMNGPTMMSSCTESLGFESSDQMEEEVPGYAAAPAPASPNSSESSGDCENWSWAGQKRQRRRREREERKEREIPPPIPSLNSNGQSRFFLRPVRANGRLVLTEVKINRPDQIFRASRQDGRLRLHVAESHNNKDQQEDIIKQEQEIEEAEMAVPTETCRKWKFPVTGGESFRRCHEITSTHHHHHHHHHHPHSHLTLWNHQCVTTR